MKRLVGLIVILVILVFGSGFLLYYLLPDMAARILTEKLNVPTRVKSISIGKEETVIHGFVMKNPKGSTIQNALAVNSIVIRSPISHYFGNPIVLDELLLSNVFISIELSRNNKIPCNWDFITQNMHGEKPHWYSVTRKGLIKKMVLTNVVIEVKQFGKKPLKLSPVPVIEFNNIDVDEGIPTSEFSKIIVSKMMGSIFSISSLRAVISAPFDAFGFFFDPAKRKKGPPDECPKYSKWNLKLLDNHF